MKGLKMELIELNEKWAVRLVLCTNAEVLDVDDEGLGANKNEMVCRAVGAAQDILYNALGGMGEEDGFFGSWQGGKFSCAEKIHASFYTREITKDEEDEDEYGEWEWQSDFGSTKWIQERLAQVPAELREKVETAVASAVEARDEVFAAFDKSSLEFPLDRASIFHLLFEYLFCPCCLFS